MTTKKKKNKWMILLGLILVLFLVCLVGGYIVMKKAKAQTYIVQQLLSNISNEVGSEIVVEYVKVDFFDNILLRNIYIADQKKDTLAFIPELLLNVESVNFKEKNIRLSSVHLDEPIIDIKRYTNTTETNLQFLLDYFLKTDSIVYDKKSWYVTPNVPALTINNGVFRWSDLNKPNKRSDLFDEHHIVLKALSVELDSLIIHENDIKGKLNSLRFKERSGFELLSANSKVRLDSSQLLLADFHVETPSSRIQQNVLISGINAKDTLDFIERLSFVSNFSNSHVSVPDLACFIPKLDRKNNTSIILNGKVSGSRRVLKGDNLLFSFADASTRFKGSFKLRTLEGQSSPYIRMNVSSLETSKESIENSPFFKSLFNEQVRLPKSFDRLGRVVFSGRFSGYLHDLVTSGTLNTEIGDLDVDLILKQSRNNHWTYEGTLNSYHFNLGGFLGIEEQFGDITMQVDVDGEGLTKENLRANVSGLIEEVNIRGYKYEKVVLSGEVEDQLFQGKLAVADENIDLDFKGKMDMRNVIPEFNFIADIKNAKLAKLNLVSTKKRLKTRFRTKLIVNATGRTFEDLLGSIEFHDAYYTDKKDSIYIKQAILNSFKIADNKKQLTLRSDVMDAMIVGDYHFEHLANYSEDLISRFIPALYDSIVHKDTLQLNEFRFNIDIHNSKLLTKLWMKDFYWSPNTSFSGKFSSKSQQFEVTGMIPSMKYKKTVIKGMQLNAKTIDSTFYVNGSIDRLKQTDSLYMEHVNYGFQLKNNLLNTNVNWHNSEETEGNIETRTEFLSSHKTKTVLDSSFIKVSNSVYSMDMLGAMTQDSTSYFVDQLRIFSGNQKLTLAGSIQESEEAILALNVEAFDIGLLKQIIPKRVIELEGIANGTLGVKEVYGKPKYTADLQLSEFKINETKIGKGTIGSVWDDTHKRLLMNGTFYRGDLPSIVFNGNYYPYEKTNLDVDFKLRRTNLHIFEHYISTYVSNFHGLVSGDFHLGGTLKAPTFEGQLKLQKTQLTVDYLNVRYASPKGVVNVSPDMISFDQILFYDPDGNQARVNGTVYHTNYRDWDIDIGLNTDRFLGLNTSLTNNELFYGKVYAKGDINIGSYYKDVIVDMDVKPSKGSVFNIPLETPESVIENNFVEFVKRAVKDTVKFAVNEQDQGKILLNMEVDMTPDILVQLIFDETVGDVIRGRGNGHLSMDIDPKGAFNMYGQYRIESGDYLFTLQNVINKKFQLENGGMIFWEGDPYNATIDLTAKYGLRARLYELLSEIDTSAVYKKRIPVDLELNLKDKLMNPTISFDIGLPTADEPTKERVRSVLYVNENQINDQELNRQAFALLAMRKFLAPAGTGFGSLQNNRLGSTNSSELLSNQVSNWLSQISDDFDVGFNYRPGDELSNDEVELALSTQFFNDRLSIDGNIGYLNDQNVLNAAEQNTNGIVGEFSIEYSLTPDNRIKMRAFNTSNQFSLIERSSPYTQGVGLYYRQDFSTTKEFFKKLLRFKRVKE